MVLESGADGLILVVRELGVGFARCARRLFLSIPPFTTSLGQELGPLNFAVHVLLSHDIHALFLNGGEGALVIEVFLLGFAVRWTTAGSLGLRWLRQPSRERYRGGRLSSCTRLRLCRKAEAEVPEELRVAPTGNRRRTGGGLSWRRQHAIASFINVWCRGQRPRGVKELDHIPPSLFLSRKELLRVRNAGGLNLQLEQVKLDLGPPLNG